MSRASSKRAAIESRMPRIICAEIAMRPMRSRSRTAIGASSTGGRSTARPGSATRKPFTQLTSGNRRRTWRNASAIPMASTPMISALSPGLARNAVQICLYSTITTSAHRIRNTSIRTRKIRGDASLNGSMSCAMARRSPHANSPHNKAGARRKEEPPRSEAGAGGRAGGADGCVRMPLPRVRGRLSRDRSRRPRLRERPQQVSVDRLVAGEDVAGRQHGLAAVEVGDEAAGLAHQRNSRRHVPRRKVALPIGVDAAGGDPGEIERGRPESPQAGDLVLHGIVLAARERDIAAAGVRERAGDDGVGEPLARRDPQAPIVEIGALAALGGEQLVVRRIVDDAGDDRSFALERNRDREMRDAVQEVQGAVERIDDPAVALVAAFAGAAFLADEPIARPRMLELRAHDILGVPVGAGHEIGRPLERDLQLLELAEIALERAARLVRGLDHHVEQGGAEHDLLGSVMRGLDPRIRPHPTLRRLWGRVREGAMDCRIERGGDRGLGLTSGSARSGRPRQERDSRASLMASSQGFAAFSAAVRMSGACFWANVSSGTSPTPPALATMCHLIAWTGSAGSPRPIARMLASRFCAMGLPLRAAFFKSAAAVGSSRPTPDPLNSAMAYST